MHGNTSPAVVYIVFFLYIYIYIYIYSARFVADISLSDVASYSKQQNTLEFALQYYNAIAI